MNYLIKTSIMMVCLNMFLPAAFTLPADQSFVWPGNKQVALSLSFDDGRPSQVDTGAELFDRHGARVTFYILPKNIISNLSSWKRAVAAGHEIGNHTQSHPCPGNFDWSRANALEDYSLDQLRVQLTEASRQIESLLGVSPRSFAYPCGETFVGRGLTTESYTPLIAELFTSGRSWQDNATNDPDFCDLAHIRAQMMDGKEFTAILAMLEKAKTKGHWVVLVGHEIGDEGEQTTQVSMLQELIAHAMNPDNGIWLAPVGEIAAYIKDNR